jgi:ribonuclease R
MTNKKTDKKSKTLPQSTDPFAAREASIYTHPIPSREFILSLLDEGGKPLSQKELAKSLDITGDQQEALRRRLRAMVRDGQLINRKGKFLSHGHPKLIIGTVSGHRDGFGFLIPDDGGDDLFLSTKTMRSLFHGDKISARISDIDNRGRLEGQIVEVLSRNSPEITGRFFFEGGVGFVHSSNTRITQEIIIPAEATLNVKPGQYVVVEITTLPTPRTQAIGRVKEILGDHMAPGMEIDIAIRANNIPFEWPPEVMHEAEKLTLNYNDGRKDLRSLDFVTIDGEDARDFDDAVFCEKTKEDGWRLCVAIADVSHYVKPGSPLDKEAEKRGTSVYFPERVIPMLPEQLSNHLCSLVPHEDRLVMVCDIELDAKGTVKDFVFYPAIIQSKARLTYTQVANYLEKKETDIATSILPMLDHLHAVYLLAEKNRKKRGAIELDITETQIIFGPEKKIDRIVPLVRNIAHRLIEECMLLANVSAAEYISQNKTPCLYRTHRNPESTKLIKLQESLTELGLQLGGNDEPTPKDYATLLASIQERPDAHLIQTLLLRSMSQAVYSPNNEGHFGLAFKKYTHFTSPIRRYPDIIVHRTIYHLLANKKPPTRDLDALGEHCSQTERRADEATRDAVSWLKCEYMLDKTGETFKGVITAVTSFGFFVELQDIYIEGLVHITQLKDDYYWFDPTRHQLKGEGSGKSFRMGDALNVLVARVDLDNRTIDFDLMQSKSKSKKKKKKK